jgi:hypothetical protein
MIDPFATAAELLAPDDDPERIVRGRYQLPTLTFDDAGRPVTGAAPPPRGWQRVTTLAKAIGDAHALDLWHQRQLIEGMVLRPDYLDLAASALANGRDNPAALRREMDRIAELILAASASDRGAVLGTSAHGFTEAQDRGLIHHARPVWTERLRAYGDTLDAHGLRIMPQWVERKVVILPYKLAGTIDRILHDMTINELVIDDLKSQKRLLTWVEIAAQLAAYALADAMWDRERGCYVDMPRVSQDIAVVAWMPAEHPDRTAGVDMFNVDLERGRAALDLAARVAKLRAEARSTRQTWGTLRPMPALSVVERFARRLADVSTRAEGSAVWAEIEKAGCGGVPELRDAARDALARLTTPML